MRWGRPNCQSTVSIRPGGLPDAWLRRVLLVPLLIGLVLACRVTAQAHERARRTIASWYGEKHRGKLMANGKRFNPDGLTAASWFYALGAKVRVSTVGCSRRSVVVTITDRGPALELVQDGRKIDLSRAAFKRLAAPDRGLLAVELELLK